LTPGSGIPKVKFTTEKCSYSTLLYYCKIKLPNIIPKFIYYYIKHSPKWFRSFYMGIQNAKLNKKYFLKEKIPIPPLPIQEEIVATLDRIFADPQDMKDCLAFTDKAMDLMLKDPSGKLLEDVVGGLRLKRSHMDSASSIKSQMGAVMRSVGAYGYQKKKLGDLCEFNTNIQKHDTSFGKEAGAYPFYTGAMNNKLFTDAPDIKDLVIIMNRTNGAGKCNLYIDSNCAVAGQTIVFYMKNQLVKMQYLI
jgi:restriction endonuclease S subunit